MKKSKLLVKKVFLTVMTAISLPCVSQAEIRLDRNFPWAKDNAVLEARPGIPIRNVVKNEILKHEQFKPDFDIANNDFRMLLNKQTYYLSALRYHSKAQINSRTPIAGGGVCALYVLDESLHLVTMKKAQFDEYGGKVFCNGIRAVGPVKGQDALLVSFSYYPTENLKLAKTADEIGDGWRYVTFLFRLIQRDGRLTLIQDDRCLGNPNTFADIPSARRAMKDRPACQQP